jgi:WD40 repeat protein
MSAAVPICGADLSAARGCENCSKDALVFAASHFEGSIWSGEVQFRASQDPSNIRARVQIDCGAVDAAWLNRGDNFDVDSANAVVACDDGAVRIVHFTSHDDGRCDGDHDVGACSGRVVAAATSEHRHDDIAAHVSTHSLAPGAFLSAGHDATAKMWNAETLQSVSAFEGHELAIEGLDWCPMNPALFASVGRDRTVRTWDVRGPGSAESGNLVQLPDETASVSWSHANENAVAVGTIDGGVFELDVRNLARCLEGGNEDHKRTWRRLHRGGVHALRYGGKTGELLATGSDDATATVLSEGFGRVDRFLDAPPPEGASDYVRAVVWLDDEGHRLLTAGWDGKVRVVDV